jgi:uncharacterized protein (DUF2235 family)
LKNIVVCCDGTGNEIGENISNVLKLYRVLRKTGKTEPQQAVYYNSGVGTLARPDPWTKFRQDAVMVLGLATGYGLDDNILSAYQFLIDQYQDGDEIFLFGFSRGAHTVRVLAALIHKVGLLAPQQKNLAGTALTAYKQLAVDVERDAPSLSLGHDEEFEHFGPLTKDDRAAQFARIVSTRWPTIKFVGVWDTVASVIVPRPDRFYAFSLQRLAHTEANPSVKIFRQAIALDERRRMFRLAAWSEPQYFMHNRFSRVNNSGLQDVLQVWFTGVHGDIGGGYRERDSGLSKFPLLWMIDEAVKSGLAVDPRTVNQLALGRQRKGSPFSYVAPSITSNIHQSLTAWWQVLEWLPKSDRYKEWKPRRSFMGHYLPNAEPRFVAPGASIHESVFERMKALGNYRPENLPDRFDVIPMRAEPGA